MRRLAFEGTRSARWTDGETPTLTSPTGVSIPWQISCGTCARCRRGQDTYCQNVAPGSCYGWDPHVRRWGGFLADDGSERPGYGVPLFCLPCSPYGWASAVSRRTA
jgi:hypothetical protein